MKHTLLAATALSLVVGATPAWADDETEALKQKVKALEARIAELEKRENKSPQTASYAAPVADKSLAQRVAVVEQQQQAAQAKADAAPTVSVGSKGLAVTSADNQYSLNVHAYAQLDDRTFFDHGPNSAQGPGTNQFLVRTARPILDAKMTDYFNARMMWDFGQGNSRLLDAYGDFHPLPGNDIINLRAGEFKVPVGLERWQSEQEIEFVERGMTTNLVPFRDIGAMTYGQLIPGQLEYQLAYVDGASDLQVNTGAADSNKDVDARLFAHPLKWTGVQALNGVGVGLGGTYGIHQGSPSSSSANITTGYLTPAQRVFFSYNPASGTVYANGPQWRLNPQVTYYNGPFWTFGEYVKDNQELKVTTHDQELSNSAWFAATGYVLTGENASFDGVKPAHNFDPKSGQWGAFEIVARYGMLHVDRDAFPLFANPTTSARNAYETTFGVNWYMNNSVKLNLDYAYTTFDGGNTTAQGGNRQDEQALLARTQIRF